jgi:hypothetical protein
MGVRQEQLHRLRVEAVAQMLERRPLLRTGHPWIDHGQSAVSAFHDVSLFTKGIARESMHHGA